VRFTGTATRSGVDADHQCEPLGPYDTVNGSQCFPSSRFSDKGERSGYADADLGVRRADPS